MATFGHIEQFSGERSEWEQYVERLEQYLQANDLLSIEVSDDGSNRVAVNARATKRRAVLLSVVGPDTYSILRSLLSPDKPASTSYENIIQTLQNYFAPTPSEAVQRFKFHSCIRKKGETIAQYVSELRKLAEKCNFGESLNDVLRDRIVCGVGDERIQRRLLLETDLTFDKAYTIAVAQEFATRDASVLQGSSTSGLSLNKVGLNKGTFGFCKKRDTRKIFKPCFRCGGDSHQPDDCRFISAECHFCHKNGHIAKVCLSRRIKNKQSSRKRKNKKQNYANLVVESDATDVLFHVHSCSDNSPLLVNVTVDTKIVNFQLDTGAGCTVINKGDFDKLYPNARLSRSLLQLNSYTGNSIKVVGEKLVSVEYKKRTLTLPLVIIDGKGPLLLGRSWIKALNLDLDEILMLHTVQSSPNLSSLLQEFDDLFSDEVGLLKDYEVTLDIEKDAKPVFCKARSVPYSMKKRIDDELHQLEKDGLIRRVKYSDWAAPVVPVIKPNGKLRLCGDYNLTINKYAKLDKYPLPLIDQIFANLSGGKLFSTLDLSQAYLQCALDESSRHLTTINTPSGLFEYLRLPFGVSSAVSLFQRAIESVLKGLDGQSAYLDDIIVTGQNEEEHLHNLRNVFTRLRDCGLKLRKEKCKFLLPNVEYLGFKISAEGIHPTESKVKAIKDAPPPNNISQLRSFIGLVNYYSRFQSNLAHHMAPLYELLKSNKNFIWQEKHNSTFQNVKDLITNDIVLVHYDPEADLVLSCDASPVGIGAVLQQKQHGKLKPVAFASRSLTVAEKNYAQIEREGLAIIFGIQKFRQYLLGREFCLFTDHQPLVKLFGENNGIPQLAASRIKRWALILSAYKYHVKYISSKDNLCADYLSRTPLQDDSDEFSVCQSDSVLFVNALGLNEIPLTSKVIAAETRTDQCLAKVLQLTREGWPLTCDVDDLKVFFVRRSVLSIEQNCILWGSRVVVPSSLRDLLLLDLHSEHMGTMRMKSLARQYFWWPNLDKDIEQITKHCRSCQENAPLPSRPPVASWNWPSGPWKRLHLDFAGPFMGHSFLIVVDSYSKWLEVIIMKSTSSYSTINQLRKLFATFGTPEHIVTDNGGQFVSSEFEEFLNKNNILITRTAPAHPATNGLAERYVGYFKKQMNKMSKDKGSLEEKLCRFLLSYRTTPHTATGETPCYLLMNRQLRTRFSSLRPSLTSRKETEVFERNFAVPKFKCGDLVFVLNLRSGPRWLAGVIINVMQSSYDIQVGQNVWKRHEDQIRKRELSVPNEQEFIENPILPSTHESLTFKPPMFNDDKVSIPDNSKPNTEATGETSDVISSDVNTHPSVLPRRNPYRERKPPERFNPSSQ